MNIKELKELAEEKNIAELTIENRTRLKLTSGVIVSYNLADDTLKISDPSLEYNTDLSRDDAYDLHVLLKNLFAPMRESSA